MGSAIRAYMADVVFPVLAIFTVSVTVGWVLAEIHIRWLKNRRG